MDLSVKYSTSRFKKGSLIFWRIGNIYDEVLRPGAK